MATAKSLLTESWAGEQKYLKIILIDKCVQNALNQRHWIQEIQLKSIATIQEYG